MSYNPSADCGDETHTRSELYTKLKQHVQDVGQDRNTHPHLLPDPTGHYGTLRGGYVPHLNQQDVDDVMNKAKLAKRPNFNLKHWSNFGYHFTFDKLREKWLKEIHQIDQNQVNDTRPENGLYSIDRFHFEDVSYEWFVKHYERPGQPCMISGLTDTWPIHTWTIQTMVQSFLEHEDVKVGKDHDGRRVGVPFDHYVHYMYTNKDDSAVYLFESQIDRTELLSRIFDSYKPPVWFSKDLFNFCHPERRPPHRWFCIGQRGTGTTIHVDPMQTTAWNSVIAGRKLWITFEAVTPEDIAEGSPFMTKPTPDPNIENEAVGWYDRVWPRLVQYLQENDLIEKYKPRVFIQYPGETIFMPGGIWHYVLNLDDTLAVTQNYVNMSNFRACWKEVRCDRRHTAIRWLAMLKKRFPIAYNVAIEANKEDNFSVKLKKPHLTGRHHRYIETLRETVEKEGETALNEKEWKILNNYNKSHAEDRVFELEEQPFQYGEEWHNWSGSDDSSTDSDESSSEDSSDSSSDSE